MPAIWIEDENQRSLTLSSALLIAKAIYMYLYERYKQQKPSYFYVKVDVMLMLIRYTNEIPGTHPQIN
jgi:hypothetical protein